MSAVLEQPPALAPARQRTPKAGAEDTAAQRRSLLKQRLKEAGAKVRAMRAASGQPCVQKVAEAATPVGAAHLARLASLRDHFVHKATAGVWSDAETREWARVGDEQRVMLMLLAGIDGDLQALAKRAWREFTPPERQAIKGEIRVAKRVFAGLAALTSRSQ